MQKLQLEHPELAELALKCFRKNDPATQLMDHEIFQRLQNTQDNKLQCVIKKPFVMDDSVEPNICEPRAGGCVSSVSKERLAGMQRFLVVRFGPDSLLAHRRKLELLAAKDTLAQSQAQAQALLKSPSLTQTSKTNTTDIEGENGGVVPNPGGKVRKRDDQPKSQEPAKAKDLSQSAEAKEAAAKKRVVRARTDPPPKEDEVRQPPAKKPKPGGGLKSPKNPKNDKKDDGPKSLSRSHSAGFSQMIVNSGGITASPPKVGAIIQVKLIHDDNTFAWYNGTVEKTREEDMSPGASATLFKILFDAKDAAPAHAGWINLISKV